MLLAAMTITLMNLKNNSTNISFQLPIKLSLPEYQYKEFNATLCDKT